MIRWGGDQRCALALCEAEDQRVRALGSADGVAAAEPYTLYVCSYGWSGDISEEGSGTVFMRTLKAPES